MIMFSSKQQHIENLKEKLLHDHDDVFDLINKAFDYGVMAGKRQVMEEVADMIFDD